jgi:hypothetical protein
VAVQLLEQQNALTFSSLKAMAEKVEGTFCFTVLDQRNDLYLVKGNNPLCLYHYPDLGLYLYASTQAILARAVSRWKGRLGRAEQVKLLEGDILRINARGKLAWSRFQTDHLFPHRYPYRPLPDSSYLQSLRSYAGFCGYDRNEVDIWLQEGFTTDEIEDFLWCGTV